MAPRETWDIAAMVASNERLGPQARQPTPIGSATHLSAEDLSHQLGGGTRSLTDANTCSLEGIDLGRGGTRGPRHDCASVPHGFALWCGEPGDIADDGFGHVVLDESGRTLFGVTTDLTDHHDRLRVGVS